MIKVREVFDFSMESFLAASGTEWQSFCSLSGIRRCRERNK